MKTIFLLIVTLAPQGEDPHTVFPSPAFDKLSECREAESKVAKYLQYKYPNSSGSAKCFRITLKGA